MEAIFTAYSLSGAAGIRVSWVMLVVAWMVHFGYLRPEPSLLWMGSWWLIALAAFASLVDFLGDKVPALDHALHAVHMALAPVAGGLSAVSGYHGDPTFAVLLAVLGGANALFVHSARTGLRAVSTAATAGVANPFLSLVEDFAAALFIAVAIVLPALTAVAMAAITIWIVKKANGMIASRRHQSA